MKILMVNKYLYPKGGAETYLLKLGAFLSAHGHEVQYFGMEHPARQVGNRVNAYTKNLDFHNSPMLIRMTYPFRVIYSAQARRQIRKVLKDFQPDVCHLNNFNYQLTPSIILEIRRWEEQSGKKCRIVYTAHDPQLVCPNHMCWNPTTGKVCQGCLRGSFWNCAKGRCIHGSLGRSILGSAESLFWHRVGIYRQLDTIICCSHFMKRLLDSDPVLAEKTVVLHNFVEEKGTSSLPKKDYVLYFGRYSQEKGIDLLAQAAKALPQIPFVFAGAGPMEHLLEGIGNIHNVGFQKGEALEALVQQARFTVIPSRWYENCPFSLLESLSCGTPVLAADIGGIPELICGTGELFEAGNLRSLTESLERMWTDKEKLSIYTVNCGSWKGFPLQKYANEILNYYR